jgi:uncharacterized protein (DUF433 family)
VPFIGLAEAVALRAFVDSGVSVRRARPALEALRSEIGISHALASRRLFSDGAEVLYDFVSEDGDHPARDLVVVRNNQRVLAEVVQEHLKLITFGNQDDYAVRVSPPAYPAGLVVLDPDIAFGEPILAKGAARVADVLGLFYAGESLQTVCGEFGLTEPEVEDVLRAAPRRAA